MTKLLIAVSLGFISLSGMTGNAVATVGESVILTSNHQNRVLEAGFGDSNSFVLDTQTNSGYGYSDSESFVLDTRSSSNIWVLY